MRIRILPFVLCLAAAACTSAPRPKDLSRADVDVRLLNDLFFGSAGTAAATLEVSVTNTAKVPITIHAVRLSSPGMVNYTLRADERKMNETLDPGGSTTISIPATLFGSPGTNIDNEEPLAVRVFLDFEANGARLTDWFNVLNVTR